MTTIPFYSAITLALLVQACPASAQDDVAAKRLQLTHIRQENDLRLAIAQREVEVAEAQEKLAQARSQLDDIAKPAATAEAAPVQAVAVAPVEPPVVAENAPAEPVTPTAEETKDQDTKRAAEDFGGFGLAPAFSLTVDLGRRDRVGEAAIVNDIVRVKDQNNTPARLMLEGHYFFKPQHTGPFGLKKNMWGFGPFVALQPGEGKIIQAVAMGLMIGFRHQETKPQSFNIGFGFIIDPDAQVLGDGFVKNQPPPAGETEIRYRETSQKGLMLITSFGF